MLVSGFGFKSHLGALGAGLALDLRRTWRTLSDLGRALRLPAFALDDLDRVLAFRLAATAGYSLAIDSADSERLVMLPEPIPKDRSTFFRVADTGTSFAGG